MGFQEALPNIDRLQTCAASAQAARTAPLRFQLLRAEMMPAPPRQAWALRSSNGTGMHRMQRSDADDNANNAAHTLCNPVKLVLINKHPIRLLLTNKQEQPLPLGCPVAQQALIQCRRPAAAGLQAVGCQAAAATVFAVSPVTAAAGCAMWPLQAQPRQQRRAQQQQDCHSQADGYPPAAAAAHDAAAP